jgi:hypothetical protein
LEALTRSRTSVSYAMERTDDLLGFGPRRDEGHVGAGGCFADRFGVNEVVLVALDEGPNELGIDEFDLMAERHQVARHVVRAGTGFHDNGAGREDGQKGDELLAGALLAEYLLAAGILPMQMERVLPKVNPNQCHFLHDGLLNRQRKTPYKRNRS